MTAPLLSLPNTASLLEATVDRLLGMQYLADGPDNYRGEFPMQLTGPVERLDHNFLTGYTLLHLTLAAGRPRIVPRVQEQLRRLLGTASGVPGHYQSAARTSNWYHGKASGCPAPAGYPWKGEVLALCDDYDDTAVSALLMLLGPFRVRSACDVELFLRAAYDPKRHVLVPKSQKRIQITGGASNVYQSWFLDRAHGAMGRGRTTFGLPVRLVPEHNSIELTTVANITTAVHLLGGSPDLPVQRASVSFVNGLAGYAVEKLLEGDASYLDFASSYYPRVPFAPLAFLVHNHALTGHWLLRPAVADLIRRAVLAVDAQAGWRAMGFANAAYWLNCAAWCVASGLVEFPAIQTKLQRVWGKVRTAVDSTGTWPDFVFFHAAHLGDYSGVAYAQALMIETMILLCEWGLD